MTIRSPKHNSQGFTLVEMLVSLIIIGIIMGAAIPSFLWLNKPLRSGALQFKAQLSLIRSKAISSTRSYRIRPNPDPDPTGTRDFIVETAANCGVTALGSTNGWQRASQLDLDLPKDIRITDIATTISEPLPAGLVPNSLGTGICFDSRGITTPIRFILKDFRGDNKAKVAMLDVSLVGNVDVYTYDSNTSTTPAMVPRVGDNPDF